MDSVKGPSTTASKSRIARAISKVLHVRALTGVSPADGFQKVKTKEKSRELKPHKVETLNGVQCKSTLKVDQQLVDRIARDALIAKLFASISSIKAAYAQLQHAQSPYDAEGIQSSDQIVISELKSLSESKQCFAKQQFDPFPEKALLTYEVEEQKNVLKTYEILGRKLESQLKLKDSEITFLKEKLEESKKENRLIEKRLNASGQLFVLDNLHMSGLSPNHFIPVLRHTIRSIRTFVRLMVNEMQSSGWNLDAAVNVIHPGVKYWKPEHKCFTFESFLCKEMFDSFHIPNFAVAGESLPDHKQRRRLFFERFTELKSVRGKDYLSQKPKSTFGKFCRVKYLRVVHPKMESSFFGNLTQRNQVNSGDYPDTAFFTTFAEMAKRIWLLHCLAFSFEPVASIFQFKKGCRFSEVYMESVSDEAFLPGTDPTVAFTVVPGFKIGKTCIQSQVYLAGA
ncbi:protein GRAVITROPIC IN THE LIGHT 1-like [Silene latifolia]|uniref:protein GRAVITROPIC IN THE LIGHT 1-like n=1 Tax=Silene latifolia TaxID=37657 RepID=UPI003D77990D